MPEDASIIGGLQINALVFTTLWEVLNDHPPEGPYPGDEWQSDLYDKIQPIQGYQYIDMSKAWSFNKSSVSVSNPGNQKLSRNNPTIQLQYNKLIVPGDLGGQTYWHISEGEDRATISDSGLLTLIDFDDITPIGLSYNYYPDGFVIDTNDSWEFPPYGGYWLEDFIEIEVDNA